MAKKRAPEPTLKLSVEVRTEPPASPPPSNVIPIRRLTLACSEGVWTVRGDGSLATFTSEKDARAYLLVARRGETP